MAEMKMNQWKNVITFSMLSFKLQNITIVYSLLFIIFFLITEPTERELINRGKGIDMLALALVGATVFSFIVVTIAVYLYRKHRRSVKQQIHEIQVYKLTFKKSKKDLSPLVTLNDQIAVTTEMTPMTSHDC